MEEFEKYILPLIKDEKVQEMRNYIQHGTITTYDHCLDVAKKSYFLSKKLHLNCESKELITGAMLHDFFLYDWHDTSKAEGLHGFSHPRVAARNAKEHFEINKKEYDIIRSHMWPLTLLHIPTTTEGVVVCMVDKYVSLKETLFHRKWRKL